MPSKASIGGTAVQLSATSTAVQYGVLVRAADANTAPIYIGYASTVTAGVAAPTTDGLPIAAGQAYFVPRSCLPNQNLTDIYAISTGGSQAVNFDVDTQPFYSGGAANVTVTADTEFPAAAALSDNFANPTTTQVGSMAMLWDGATWDRALGDSSNGTLVSGNLASDAVDAGNPVKVGAQARTTNPTAVADADRVNLIADKLGKLIAVGAIRELKGMQSTTITSSTAETTIVTAVASTFLDLYGLIVANTSATATTVTIKDSTSGTTRATIRVPAGDTRGFMLPVDSALPQATVNNNWTATCADSVASIVVSAYYVKNI